MARLYPTLRSRCSRAELLQRARHLGIDVELVETLAGAPFVAGDDELAHLLGEPRPARGGLVGRLEQSRDLGVDIERRAAPANEALAAGGEHLADLDLPLGPSRRGVRRLHGRATLGFEVVFARESALADLVVEASAAEQGPYGHHDRERHRTEQDDREGVLHPRIVA